MNWLNKRSGNHFEVESQSSGNRLFRIYPFPRSMGSLSVEAPYSNPLYMLQGLISQFRNAKDFYNF